jgi:hypothetical protein
MTGLRRAALVGVILAAMATTTAAGQKQEGKLERPFAPGRHLWMDLSSGNYRVRQGGDDKVVVRWESLDPDSGPMKVTLDARGSDTSIVTRADSGEFRVTVEIPARTDLTVRLSAGDIRVEGISGNKDVNSWAGKVEIEVKDPKEYRSVDASVTAGDLDASAFDVKKGGLFRSFSWKGPGAYTLLVRLTAGDLRLVK